MNRNIAKDNLEKFKQIMDEVEVPFFLLYGTLLGAVREKAFIAHDTDIDIGIYDGDRELFIVALGRLIQEGFQLIRTKIPDDLVTIMRDDEYIDIGIFTKNIAAGKEIYKYQRNAIAASSLDSLESIIFYGSPYAVPKDREKLLCNWYGNDWRRPQKNLPASDMDTKAWKKIANKYRLTRMAIDYARKIRNYF